MPHRGPGVRGFGARRRPQPHLSSNVAECGVELHVGALAVVTAAGLVDVVGLHLVGPVHLAGFLVLPVQPAGGTAGQGLRQGVVGSWAHPDARARPAPRRQGASSADGAPGCWSASGCPGPLATPIRSVPSLALCSLAVAGDSPSPLGASGPGHPTSRLQWPEGCKRTGSPRGQLWRPPRPTGLALQPGMMVLSGAPECSG